MTGYHISIGYNPTRCDYAEMWAILQREARTVADAPGAIVAEARRLDAPEKCEKGCCELETYADNYAKPFETFGHPVSVVDRGEEDQEIMQLASTDKGFKYHVRRAFVRLLIEAMHRHGIEVNLHVV